MKGYKVFDSNWSCKGMQYKVGEKFEMIEKPIICMRGYHFCKKIVDCFNYYNFSPSNKVAEIEAYGDIVCEEEKCCTNKIKIIRELSWEEVLKITNIGDNCTGIENCGNCNSGNRNTGDCNSENWNTGYKNEGDKNTGSFNIGFRNTGDCNNGSWNTGDYNSGFSNTGDYNSGVENTGDYNEGDCNTGDNNSGFSNTGNYNSGNRNTGDYNEGCWNTGNWNTGDNNTGDWNTGNRNTGSGNIGNNNTGNCNLASNCVGSFNTISQPLMFFDNPSNITLEEWSKSRACYLLNKISDFVNKKSFIMNDFQVYIKWWESLSKEDKEIIKSIPNFDNEKFFKITEIRVR